MRQTALLTGLVAFGSVAFAADPQLMSLVMPDAKILAGVNVTNARISPFGQFVISKLATPGAGEQKFAAATGFDPFQDVSEVLAAATADKTNPNHLLLARGNFNVDKIVAAATGYLNAQVQTDAGSTLLSFTNSKTKAVQALAFIGNSIAVAGELASVEAAIARNGASSITIDPVLAAEVDQLSSTEDEWMVSSVPFASLIPAIPANAAAPSGPAAQLLPILKNIQSFGGGLNFGENVQLTGQIIASDEQSATALASVIKLAANFASMSTGNNAQLAQLSQLLQTVQVTPHGSSVGFSASIPEVQVEALLNQGLKPTVRPRSQRLPN